MCSLSIRTEKFNWRQGTTVEGRTLEESGNIEEVASSPVVLLFSASRITNRDTDVFK